MKTDITLSQVGGTVAEAVKVVALLEAGQKIRCIMVVQSSEPKGMAPFYGIAQTGAGDDTNSLWRLGQMISVADQLNNGFNRRSKGERSMVLSLIRNHRSIRRFQSRQVEQEKVDSLIEAALRAPSSRNLKPWELIVVDSPEILVQLSRSKPYGASFLAEAPLAVVICADPERCDVWIEDCSIVASFILLTAESLGLGGCWIQIRKRVHDGAQTAGDFIRQVLDIPGNLEVEAIVAVGYPGENPKPHPREELEYTKVHKNRFLAADES